MKLICAPEDELRKLIEDYKKLEDEFHDDDGRQAHYYMGRIEMLEELIKNAEDV